MSPNRKPYKIIFSSGVSVLRNLRKHFPDVPEGHEASYLTTKKLSTIGASRYELSAEISLMNALAVGPGDECALLTTNTASGRAAAMLVRTIAEKLWNGFKVDIVNTKVELDDARSFKKSGLPDFMQRLDNVVSKAKSNGFDTVISVSAGVNQVLPYLTIYGMMHRLTCAYVYEPRHSARGVDSRSPAQRLVLLPRLPLSFDLESLRIGADVLGALKVLDDVEESTSIPIAKLRSALGDHYDALEGLFEPVNDKEVTLSAFAFLLNDFRRAGNTRVWLSRSAHRRLQSLKGERRTVVDAMLNGARIPLWRESHIHPLQGTDTDITVYKDRRTTRRIAGWLATDGFYVAEIFVTQSQYQSYARSVMNKRRDDYREEEFVEFTRTQSTMEDESVLRSDEDKTNRELARIAQLEEANRTLSKSNEGLEIRNLELSEDNNEMKKAKKSIEIRLTTLSSELGEIRTERDKAVAVERTFAGMNLARRLRWCFTGRR